jgi:L-cysteine/cystine lyase
MDGVTPVLSVPPTSGLVSFQLGNSPAPADVVTALGKQGIWIRDLTDPACLRACTHITTSKEELVQLSEALATHQG